MLNSYSILLILLLVLRVVFQLGADMVKWLKSKLRLITVQAVSVWIDHCVYLGEAERQ